MTQNPSHFQGSDLPAERVNWKQALEFLAVFNSHVGGEHFRLPTEAEWEWAARSSTNGTLVGWNNVTAGGTTHAVGQLAPNPLGIYDLHGNVLEWCLDGYQDYSASDRRDPLVAPSDAIFRVVRGGCWTMPPTSGAPWIRHRYQPFTQLFFIGVRIAANG
jgi:formylglycine-generating enzyme required for sulfatase activity